MTAAFDCPQCGAPLNFEPHPGDETVECPFCHQTVIIPKDLRVRLPRTAIQQQPSPVQSRPVNRVVGVFAFIGVLAVLAIIIAIASPSDQPSTDLAIDTPFFGSGSSATATIEAKATTDALQPILKLEQSWPVIFTEKFTDNSHKWDTGDVRDSYITGNRSISDGIYTWKITSIQSASDFSLPDTPDQVDFYASVDMKLINMPDDPDSDAGLVFRYNSTARTWYYFSVNNQGQYYFGWFDGSDWYSLIPETDSAAIHPGQTNRLTVGVQGSQFIFLINGQMVDHFIDDHLKSGNIGVGVNLPQAGEKASVEFANFTVQSSAPNP
jgi:hypothetical protein